MPTLARLQAGPHHVVGVVSQPDRRAGRGRRLRPCAVAEHAEAAGLPLLRPERVASPESVAALRGWAPDLGLVVAFGQFLPRSVRSLPSLGYLVNGHASLLPRYRGAAPIAHAMLAGDPETGISVMRVEREMDAGPVALERRLAIDSRETRGELEARLADLCADAIAAALDAIAAGDVQWCEQDHSQASVAPKIGRDDARLDFRSDAASLVRRVHAMAPRPGAFTHLAGEPLRILRADRDDAAVQAATGSVAVHDGCLRVATGRGWLLPLELQRAGGRPLGVGEFLRGRPIPDGTRLGDDEAIARLPT